VSDTFDVIIAGGGIAGLTAAATAARLGLRTLILSGNTLGGHLVTIEKIDGFPGHPEGVPGFDLCPATEEMAAEAGAEFIAEEASSLVEDGEGWRLSCDSGDYRARAVILATGTSLKELGLANEQAWFGRGVSHCASCDAPLLRGKQVAVAGGGDSALQEALTLAPVAAKVTIVTTGERLTAQAAYRQQIEAAANVEVRASTRIVELLGEDGLTGLRLSGPGGESVLEVASLFVFVGLQPASALAPPGLTDADGYILADASMRTVRKGLYACGTVRAGAAFRAASAAGEGAAAALSVFADVQG